MWLFNLLEPTTDTNEGGGSNITTIIIMAVLIVGIIGLFVWQTISGRKKQKQAQDMVNTLKIGDRVKTIGGICGFVAQINDAENTFVLETGLEDNKSYVKFDKGAIYQTAPAQGNAVAEPAPAVAPVEEVKVEEPFAEVVAEEKPKKASAKKKSAPKAENKEEVVETTEENK